jgi:hypothetical protein
MRSLCCVLLISRLMLVQAMPQGRFDGVWKVDLAESQSSTKTLRLSAARQHISLHHL